jgi:hypothetical protein
MLSPAKASFQRKLAAKAAGLATTTGAPAMPEDGPVATEYQQLLAALGVDLRELQNIMGTDRKIEAKRRMIAKYGPWLQGVLTGDGGAQDEIVVTMLVWAIDIAAWPLALDLATYVLKHGLALPERYKRKPATLIAEEVAEAGLVKPATVDLDTLQRVSLLTADQDMHDQVRAKLEKALGLGFKARLDAWDPEADSQPAGGKGALVDAALAHLGRALGLDANSGVKKLIEGLERERKALASPAP